MKSLFLVFSLAYSFLSFSSEDSTYDFEWLDEDKEIYVLQNRKFRKDGNFIISGLFSNNISSKFTDSYGGIIRGDYFISEDWGVEFSFGAKSGELNSTGDAVLSQSAVPFYRDIKSSFGAGIIWSPFYGKFNTFNLIYYLDWYITAGITSVSTEDNREAFTVSDKKNAAMTSESLMSFTWSTGLFWNLSESWAIRFEFVGHHFQADKFLKETGVTYSAKKGWFHNYDMNLGVSLKF